MDDNLIRGGSADPRPAEPQTTELATRRPDDWQALGEAFEAMGKAGLALAIGFSVAAGVCKMAQSGNFRIPDLNAMLGIKLPGDQEKKKPS